jgi:hypothetical protein
MVLIYEISIYAVFLAQFVYAICSTRGIAVSKTIDSG